MADIIRMCIEREAPPRSPHDRLALVTGLLWPANTTLHVSTIGAPASIVARVRAAVQPWKDILPHGPFLYFDDAEHPQIRISFKPGGSWSYVGKQCADIPEREPTMNLGWIDEQTSTEEVNRVVLHEFGHALGCIHEHQNPAGGIPWNEDAVYAYYGGPPNNWSRKVTKHNVLDALKEDLTVHSAVDRDSIMMYPIPAKLVKDPKYATDWNRSLSAGDIAFIKKVYP